VGHYTDQINEGDGPGRHEEDGLVEDHPSGELIHRRHGSESGP
jgi:hypothetical protein